MPAWSATLDEAQIRGLAILISEKRAALGRTDFKTDMPLVIPEGVIESEEQAFRIESVASGLDPLPFSIAPLPDGRILLTEKMRGLSIVSPDGKQSALIEGTPPAHDDGLELADLVYGRGWLLDVALHPDYAKNGWVYLHFGDRCRDCDTSMNKLIRGRIADGRWIDEETIWSAAPETYNKTPDMGAGGRIAFDGNGHVFLSVGIKGSSDHDGDPGPEPSLREDPPRPRRRPDCRRTIPSWDKPGALPSTWSYGHRSPQGLEFDPVTGRLWSTEMGPRGGDEFNLLRPGRNYGWPLTSKGVNYDGTPVAWGKELGITLDLATIEQPVVDLTPSPAVSSFVLYRGSAFPGWQDDAIVGTLKATELYRFVIEGERVVHRETLLKGLARIRDVEVGPDGLDLPAARARLRRADRAARAGGSLDQLVLVRRELVGQLGPLEAAGREPAARARFRALDEPACGREVVGRQRDRTERGHDPDLAPLPQAQHVHDQLARDQQRERVERHGERAARRLRERARVAGRQHEDPLRPELDRGRERGVARDASVDQVPAVELDGREDAGDGRAREERVGDGPGREHDLAAVEDVRGDDRARQARVLEALVRELARDERTERRRIHQAGAPAEEAQQALDHRDGEDVGPTEPAPDRREALHAAGVRRAGVVRRVDGADGGSDHEVGPDAALDQDLQHAHLDRAEAASTREDEGRAHAGSLRRRPAQGRME